jgi:hypothetical protein
MPDPPGSSTAAGEGQSASAPRVHSRPPRDPEPAWQEPHSHPDPDQGDQPHRSPTPAAPPPLGRGSPAHPGRASAGNRAPPAGPRRRHESDAPDPPVRSPAPPPDSRITRPAHRRTASSAQQAGARSGCTDRPVLVAAALSESSAQAAAQTIQSDSVPHCCWSSPGGLPMAPTGGTLGATGLSRRAVGFIRPAAA